MTHESGLAMLAGVDAQKSLGQEIAFDPRPIRGQESIDIPLDQHGPDRAAVRILSKRVGDVGHGSSGLR